MQQERETDPAEPYLADIERQLGVLEQQEKARLGIQPDETQHWYDPVPNRFTAEQRATTTILHAGLTLAHDLFIQSAFRGLGYRVEAMDVPDGTALRNGREFGNRGQCNPTYFTVGNLIKKLKQLESKGLSKQQIVENYLFATAGSCGPCRFGTYVTEYRKALRDAGFEGFRVILFQQSGGVKQATGESTGLEINARFFITCCKAILLGDVLNALGYRIRPYEIQPGATDAALQSAQRRIARAFETGKGLLKALWITRRELAAIRVDRTKIKPRVAIIGEFWAMTTEGDGNYQMHRFLEQEGAEVDIQLVTSWGLYLVWSARYDLLERARLKGVDSRQVQPGITGSKAALEGVNVLKKRWQLFAAEWFLRGLFGFYARVLGLKQAHLPDMDHLAEISHRFYDNNLRGGEGHMEVGKLIHNVLEQTVNMTLSIKPFGCMPSSGVSDGVQSLITELYPQAVFLPIETTGDGAVNVYSRVQMQLFKARKSAQKDVADKLTAAGIDPEAFSIMAQQTGMVNRALYRSDSTGACTALDLLNDLLHRQQRWDIRLWRRIGRWFSRADKVRKQRTIQAVERAAQQYRQTQSDRFDAVRIMEP